MAGCIVVRYGWTAGRVAGWAGATTASALIAWAALQPVLDTAVPDRFAPLTGAELRAEAAAPVTHDVIAATPGPPVETSISPEVTPGEEPNATPTSDEPADQDDGPSGSDVSGAGDPRDEPQQDPAGPPDEPEVTEYGWTVIESEAGTSYVQTFDTDGGTATFEVEPGQATLVSATPIEPYAIDVYHEDPERVVVQFYVTNHMWVVEAMWWENGPYAAVTEVPE